MERRSLSRPRSIVPDGRQAEPGPNPISAGTSVCAKASRPRLRAGTTPNVWLAFPIAPSAEVCTVRRTTVSPPRKSRVRGYALSIVRPSSLSLSPTGEPCENWLLVVIASAAKQSRAAWSLSAASGSLRLRLAMARWRGPRRSEWYPVRWLCAGASKGRGSGLRPRHPLRLHCKGPRRTFPGAFPAKALCSQTAISASPRRGRTP